MESTSDHGIQMRLSARRMRSMLTAESGTSHNGTITAIEKKKNQASVIPVSMVNHVRE
jgi:hypothetical protein